jgi:hypothetical protein
MSFLCVSRNLFILLAYFALCAYVVSGYKCREGYVQHSLIHQYHDQLNHRRPMLTDVFLSTDRRKIYGIVTLSTLFKLHGRTHKRTWRNPWNVTGDDACKWAFEWPDGRKQRATLLEEDPSRENIIFYANTTQRFRNITETTDQVQFVNVTGRATKRFSEVFYKVPFCLPKNAPRKHFMAACTSTTGSMTVAKMVEWLSYHLLQGFTHFYIHFNGVSDNNPYWTEQLQRYIDAGLVTIVNRMQPRLYKDLHRFQSSIFHSCLYRSRGRVEWLGLFDTDEFWVLPQANKGQGLGTSTGVGKDSSVHRETLVSWIRQDEFKNVSAIRSRTWHFGDYYTKTEAVKEAELAELHPLQLVHHKAHAPEADYSRTKMMIRPNHVVWSTLRNITTMHDSHFHTYDVPVERLFLMHFYLSGMVNFSDTTDVAGVGDLIPILREAIVYQKTDISPSTIGSVTSEELTH